MIKQVFDIVFFWHNRNRKQAFRAALPLAVSCVEHFIEARVVAAIVAAILFSYAKFDIELIWQDGIKPWPQTSLQTNRFYLLSE